MLARVYQRVLPCARLFAEDAAKWADFTETYAKVLSSPEHDEPWRVFHAIRGELPTDSELGNFDAFVLSGSHYSAYEDRPWIHDEADFIRRAHALAQTRLSRTPKLVCICFGCQLAAQALGGAIAKNGHESFVLRSELVSFTKAAEVKPFMRPLVEAARTTTASTPPVEDSSALDNHPIRDSAGAGADAGTGAGTGAGAGAGAGGAGGVGACGAAPAPSSGVSDVTCGVRLLESHGDRVHKVPPRAEVLGVSRGAPLEMWCLDDCVLSIQGHPEFEHSTVLDKIFPAIKAAYGWDDKEAQCRREAVLVPHGHDAFLATVRLFITGGGTWPEAGSLA